MEKKYLKFHIASIKLNIWYKPIQGLQTQHNTKK